MPHWDAGTWATVVLAFCALVGGAAELTIRTHRVFRRRRIFWNFMLGSPGDTERGIPAIPSMPSRMELLEKRSEQLEPNGGSTLADKVAAFGEAFAEHAQLDEKRHQEVMALVRTKT